MLCALRSPSPSLRTDTKSQQCNTNGIEASENDAFLDPSQARVNRALDTALAMQLHPGLGLGIAVDAAWLVCFVMAFFGWFAILLSGRRPE